jgi:hypothetical protein
MLFFKKAFACLGLFSLTFNIVSPVLFSYAYITHSQQTAAVFAAEEPDGSGTTELLGLGELDGKPQNEGESGEGNYPEGEILEGFSIQSNASNNNGSSGGLPTPAECEQDPYCHKIDPGTDEGSYTAPGTIVEFGIWTGSILIDWTPEGSDHELAYCWDVSISGTYVEWSRLFDNRFCQDPSAILITWIDLPVIPTGSISGYKFEDVDGNSRKDEKDPGVSDFKIFIDANGNGKYDEGELHTKTGLGGYYIFEDLPLGTHIVCEVQKDDWTQTYPKDGCHTVELKKEDKEVENINFGNFAHVTISGHKFNDLDGDREWGDGESYIPGWKFILEKEGGGGWSFISEIYSSESDGSWSFDITKPGTYRVIEEEKEGWIYSTHPDRIHGPLTIKSGKHVGDINFGNYEEIIEPEYATIIAHKIVCEDESLLPNWGISGPNITSTTAQDFVTASEGQCWFEEGWDFQWGYSNAPNPGDNTGEDVSGHWFTFGPTGADGKATTTITELYDHPFLWMREVFKSGYIPFTYGLNDETNVDDYTAEFYCHTDVHNYDNYDRVDGIEYGGTYYCIAFNVPEPVDTSSIGGYKYADYNGDGIFDPEIDEPIEDWEISICRYESNLMFTMFEVILEPDCILVGTTTTDSTGWYEFTGLTEGFYRITEEQRPDTHTVISPVGGVYDNIDPFVQEGDYNFFNQPHPPELLISKLNDWDGEPLKPGDLVVYTLILEVLNADLQNVQLTDLSPGGFDYVAGSYSALLNGNPLAISEPTYASPGVWYLGDLSVGDIVTLTYTALITDTVKAGLYRDLAWAIGGSKWGNVLATATEVGNISADNFVGTHVEVALALEPDPADVKVTVTTEEIVGEVLGAMILPETGAKEMWLYTMLAVLMTGLSFIAGGLMLKDKNRRKRFTNLLKVSLTAFGLFMIVNFALTGGAYADSLYVRLSQPKSPTNTTFNLDFVVLDNQQRPVTVKCFKKFETDAAFTQFGDDVNLAAGGTSGVCAVTAAVLASDGMYTFRVSAQSGGDPEVLSEEVKVEYDGTNPGRPQYIEKSKKSACEYEITFRTADDGQTSYVEVYRSTNTEFKADASTRIRTINIGSDKKTYLYGCFIRRRMHHSVLRGQSL